MRSRTGIGGGLAQLCECIFGLSRSAQIVFAFASIAIAAIAVFRMLRLGIYLG